MEAKIAIVYVSTHHGNTKKVVEAMAAERACDLYPAERAKDVDFSKYDVVGFASGVYFQSLSPVIAAVQGAEVVVLAVKPQYINALMEEIAEELDVETLVISIAAGVSLSRLQEYLNTGNLIRVMPNTPARIGSGVSGWIADRSVSEEDKAYVRSFLAQVGIEVEVRNEDQIDQIGAISGSGPAFVYLFMEAMIDTGVHMGMTREAVTELVTQTLIGSAEYLYRSGIRCEADTSYIMSSA